MELTGWLVNQKEARGELVVLWGDKFKVLERNVIRADVQEKVVSKNAKFEERIQYGFRHFIPIDSDYFTINLLHESEITPLYKCNIKGAFEVIEGENGWLYLDNDTNKSVEQFQGKVKLTRAAKKEWINYMRDFTALTESLNIPSCFLVAPSKEYVVTENYPIGEFKNTPLQQLEKIMIKGFPLLVPSESLKKYVKPTFRVCDTHWNAHGAMVATLEMCAHLNLDAEEIKSHFSEDVYETKEVGGDLGAKLFPPKTHPESILTSHNYRDYVLYDNALPNFGRLIHISNSNAMLNKTLIFFGSSSAYSMFNYVYRIFRNTVFFHTAGSIDKSVLEKISPDYLVAQSNARFLVRAPSTNIQINSIVNKKKKFELSDVEIESTNCEIDIEINKILINL
ncbi:alginate O-acetyltransferase AlgX-related protein [Alteromonas sp. H39]|uniref:alginate O-acetyltransferase AlgX-related protein n=1 Tax=Alteromonas sp. H39 TaxID=3389876 RepID=UPI0039E0E7A1